MECTKFKVCFGICRSLASTAVRPSPCDARGLTSTTSVADIGRTINIGGGRCITRKHALSLALHLFSISLAFDHDEHVENQCLLKHAGSHRSGVLQGLSSSLTSDDTQGRLWPQIPRKLYESRAESEAISRQQKKCLFTLHFLQVEETSVGFIHFPTFYSNTISNSCVNTAFILKFLNDDTLQNPSGLVHHQADHVQRSGSIGAFRLILCRWVSSVNLRPRMTSVSQIRMVML